MNLKIQSQDSVCAFNSLRARLSPPCPSIQASVTNLVTKEESSPVQTNAVTHVILVHSLGLNNCSDYSLFIPVDGLMGAKWENKTGASLKHFIADLILSRQVSSGCQ
jgi:hypothetical protein